MNVLKTNSLKLLLTIFHLPPHLDGSPESSAINAGQSISAINPNNNQLKCSFSSTFPSAPAPVQPTFVYTSGTVHQYTASVHQAAFNNESFTVYSAGPAGDDGKAGAAAEFKISSLPNSTFSSPTAASSSSCSSSSSASTSSVVPSLDVDIGKWFDG